MTTDTDKYEYYWKSGFISTVTKVSRFISSPLSLWLQVQILSTKVFGIFVLSRVIVNITSEIAGLNFNNLIQHRVPKIIDKNNSRARNIVGQSLLTALVTVSVAMSLLIIFRIYLTQFFGYEGLGFWVFWLALLAPMATIRDLHGAWLTSNERIAEGCYLGGIIPHVTTLTGYTVVWWFNFGAPGIVVVIFAERFLSLFPWLISEQLFLNANTSTLHWQDFRYTLELLGSRITSILNTNIDILMLGWLGTASMTAVYKIGSALGSAVRHIQGLSGNLFKPRISRFLGEEKYDELKREFTVLQRLNIIAVISVLAGVFMFGKPILGLFGEQYRASFGVLLILLIGRIVELSSGKIIEVLKFDGRSGWVLSNFALAFLFNLIGNYFLIQSIGAEGAAWAWAGSVIVLNLLAVLEHFVLIPLNLFPPNVAFSMILGVTMGLLGLYSNFNIFILTAPLLLIISYHFKQVFPRLKKLFSNDSTKNVFSPEGWE